MCKLPVIDMTQTGQNIARLRQQKGLTVKELQDIFGFAPQGAVMFACPRG